MDPQDCPGEVENDIASSYYVLSLCRVFYCQFALETHATRCELICLVISPLFHFVSQTLEHSSDLQSEQCKALKDRRYDGIQQQRQERVERKKNFKRSKSTLPSTAQ